MSNFVQWYFFSVWILLFLKIKYIIYVITAPPVLTWISWSTDTLFGLNCLDFLPLINQQEDINKNKYHLVTGSDDGHVQIWDAATGAALQNLTRPYAHVRAVTTVKAFGLPKNDNDSTTVVVIAAGYQDGAVVLWEGSPLKNFRPLQTLKHVDMGRPWCMHVVASQEHAGHDTACQKNLLIGYDKGCVLLPLGLQPKNESNAESSVVKVGKVVRWMGSKTDNPETSSTRSTDLLHLNETEPLPSVSLV